MTRSKQTFLTIGLAPLLTSTATACGRVAPDLVPRDAFAHLDCMLAIIGPWMPIGFVLAMIGAAAIAHGMSSRPA